MSPDEESCGANPAISQVNALLGAMNVRAADALQCIGGLARGERFRRAHPRVGPRPAGPPPRLAPAGAGEEYRVGLGSGSKVGIVTSVGTYTSALSGSIGYSFCPEGSATEACPLDGVLIDRDVRVVTFTDTRTLEALATDARGATTTAKKVVSCG
jgi:hypothetical protein